MSFFAPKASLPVQDPGQSENEKEMKIAALEKENEELRASIRAMEEKIAAMQPEPEPEPAATEDLAKEKERVAAITKAMPKGFEHIALKGISSGWSVETTLAEALKESQTKPAATLPLGGPIPVPDSKTNEQKASEIIKQAALEAQGRYK